MKSLYALVSSVKCKHLTVWCVWGQVIFFLPVFVALSAYFPDMVVLLSLCWSSFNNGSRLKSSFSTHWRIRSTVQFKI